MLRHRLLALLALSTAAAVPAFVACSSSSSNGTSSSDAGPDAGIDADDYTNDAFAGQNLDAGPPNPSQCLLYPTEDDPVGLCLQKEVIQGMHAQLTQAGLPAAWSIASLAPVTDDAGATIHDMKDDVAYGASLSAYAASANAYQDTSINATVSADLGAVAQLVETELATLPSDYDGALYLLLRRFAAGLRVAGLTTHATNIDTLALDYGKAIYTNWFHPLATPVTPAIDAGDNDAGENDAGDDSGATPADAGATDAGGAFVDGILGAPSGSGYAYSADKEAAGALALIELATRATNGTLLPTGADAAAPTDAADALAWSQAGAAVFHHLTTRARAASGLYLTQLLTSGDAVHDTVTDDGSLSSLTQGAVVLSFAHMADLLTATPEASLAASTAANAGVAVLAVMQTQGNLWNTAGNVATLPACAASTSCGGGYFLSLDSTGTVLDRRESSIANARIFAALQRLKKVAAEPQIANLVPMSALFVGPAVEGSFFGIVANQSAMVDNVTAQIRLTSFLDGGSIDGGPLYPMALDYTAQATNEVVEAMNAQWLGHPTGAPPFFQ